MKRCLFTILVFVLAVVLPAEGGIFGKKTRVKPENHLPELLKTAKSDADEGKRTAAIAELRDYDIQSHPDIVPQLIDVLQNDTRPGVRREAASTLGRLRPSTPAAGQALQQAASNDPSLRVRIQAWSSLKLVQLNGHNHRPKQPQAPPSSAKRPTTDEPPLLDPPLRPLPLRPLPGTVPMEAIPAGRVIGGPKSPSTAPRIIEVPSPVPTGERRDGPAIRNGLPPTQAPPPQLFSSPPIIEEGPLLMPQNTPPWGGFKNGCRTCRRRRTFV